MARSAVAQEVSPVTDGITEARARPPAGRATYADLEALPGRYVGELIDRRLYTQARPASPHARAMNAINGPIDTHFDDAVVGIEPFAALPLALADLWLD